MTPTPEQIEAWSRLAEALRKQGMTVINRGEPEWFVDDNSELQSRYPNLTETFQPNAVCAESAEALIALLSLVTSQAEELAALQADIASSMASLNAEVTASEALRERVRTVLEPIVPFVERNSEPWDGAPITINLAGMPNASSLTMGNLRRARSLHAEMTGGKADE